MDKEMKQMFNTIIEEIGRLEERTNKRFDKMEEHFDQIENSLADMRHEVNACKLERDSVDLLIRKMDEHERRIKELEVKTA